jgi:exonuclease VII small subunit
VTRLSIPRPAPVLVLALALAGCATRQQTSGLECGVTAGAAALVLCKLMGKSDRDCAGLGVVGAGLGAAACYSYAGRLEQRREQLAGHEHDLDARLAYVRGLNEDGAQLNRELQARVESASQRVAALAEQSRRQQVTAEQVARERRQLDGEIRAANQQVTLQQGALVEVKGLQKRGTSPDLDREIARQDRLLAQAQQHLATMVSMRESLPT